MTSPRTPSRLAAGAAVVVGVLLVTSQPSDARPLESHRHVTPGASTTKWVWPLDPLPQVVQAFDPPANPWEVGHRGVDLLGAVAEPVRSIAAGTIAFAGPLAGRGVVVVDHGALRSTYEPVTANVHVGDQVDAGAVIGLLQSTRSHCPPESCLHLGLRRKEVYLDPLSVLGPQAVRLKPLGAVPTGPSVVHEPGMVPRQELRTPARAHAPPARDHAPPLSAGWTTSRAASARLSTFTAGVVSAVTSVVVTLTTFDRARA